MRFHRAFRLTSLTFVLLSSSLVVPPVATSDSHLIGAPEKSLFILDVSGSTEYLKLWKYSLRPSIVNKLAQPFGYPKGATRDGKGVAPTDITLFAINGNSYDAPILPIVTQEYAEEIWSVVDDVGFHPSKDRLKEISDGIFGGQGIYTTQSRSLKTIPVQVPSRATCEQESLKALIKSTSGFLRDADLSQRKQVASVTCKLINQIAINLRAADDFFSKSQCPGNGKPCSDIFGALVRASDIAKDLQSQNRSGLCIAIASDMLHNKKGMTKESVLNSRKIAETLDKETARMKGVQAAQDVDLNFPKLSGGVRVVVLGQGTGKSPIPTERRSILNSYWNGVWQQSGIAKTAVTSSLDRACQGTNSQ